MWAEHLPNLWEKQHRAVSLLAVQASEAEVRAVSSCLKGMKSFTFWPCRLDTRRKCLLSSVICCHWREAIKEKLSASRDNCWASEWMQQIKEDAAYPERQSGKEQRSVSGNCAHLRGKGNGEEGEMQRKAGGLVSSSMFLQQRVSPEFSYWSFAAGIEFSFRSL